MGSQRVRHDWATELNWVFLNSEGQTRPYVSMGCKSYRHVLMIHFTSSALETGLELCLDIPLYIMAWCLAYSWHSISTMHWPSTETFIRHPSVPTAGSVTEFQVNCDVGNFWGNTWEQSSPRPQLAVCSEPVHLLFFLVTWVHNKWTEMEDASWPGPQARPNGVWACTQPSPAQPSMECWHHHSQAGSCSQERRVYFLSSTRSRQAGTGRKPHRPFADSSWGTGLGWAGLGWAGLAARWVRPFQASSCWEKTRCSGGLGPSPGLDPLWLLACSPGHV